MKKLLILGGTNFIGRNLVEQLLKENIYEIFLFNRQLSNAKLFPTINKIKGDRETDEINQISNHQWDFVIDLSCYFPQDLEATIKNLKGQNLRYLLISSCSVYNSKNLKEMKTENAEQLNCSTFEKTDRTDLSYGNRKAECERILKRSGHNYSILRPALVFGKYDSSDRFYYWLYQVKMKNQILIPENGLGNFSITYVEDLVSAIVNSLKQDTHSKTYNIITDPRSSIKKIVEEGNSIMSKKINPINASSSFLDANNIHEWLGPSSLVKRKSLYLF